MKWPLRQYMDRWAAHLRTHQPRRQSHRQVKLRRNASLVLIVLILVLGGYIWRQTRDPQVTAQTIKAIQRITGGQVQIENASLEVLRQIRIQGLKLYPPDQPQTEENLILMADDVILEHQPWSLFWGPLRLNRVVANKAELFIRYDLDHHQLNLQGLSLLHQRAHPTERPLFILRHGVILYQEKKAGISGDTIQQEITSRLFPDEKNQGLYRFEMTSSKEGMIPETVLSGTYDIATKKLDMEGEFRLESFTIAGVLPGRLAFWQQLYQQMKPQGKISLKGQMDPKTGGQVSICLNQGQANWPLPNTHTLIPLDQIQAELVCDEKGVQIRRFQGLFRNQTKVSLAGTLAGYHPEAPFDLRFQTTNLNIPENQWDTLPALPEDWDQWLEWTQLSSNGDVSEDRRIASAILKQLPDRTRKLIYHCRPTGQMDIDIQVSRDAGRETKKKWNGNILFRDVNMIYRRFPYPVTGLQGEISFQNRQLHLGPLTAEMDSQRIRIQGQSHRTEDQHEYNIEVHVENAVLNERLYQALDEKLQRVWDRFQPAGRADAVYIVKKTAGEKERTQQLTATFKNARACFRSLPIPLSELDGEIQTIGRNTDFTISHGRALGGTVYLKGQIENLLDQNPALHCRGQARNLEITPEIETYLPKGTRPLLEKWRIHGLLDTDFRIQPLPTASTDRPQTDSSNKQTYLPDWFSTADYDLSFHLKDGRLLWEEYPTELDQVDLQCQLTPGQTAIQSLAARNGQGHIDLTGNWKDNSQWQLSMKGRDWPVDQSLLTFLNKRKLRQADSFKPEGQTHFDIQIQRTKNQDTPDYHAVLEPTDCQIQIAPDYLLKNASGKIIAMPEKTTIQSLTSTDGDQKITLSGTLESVDENKDWDLQIQTQNARLASSLTRFLPESWKDDYQKAQPSGQIDAQLHLIRKERPEPKISQWSIEGNVLFQNTRIASPLVLDHLNGSIQGKLDYQNKADGIRFTGELLPTSGNIYSRPIRQWAGQIDYPDPQGQFRFTNITGNFCGGQIAGWASNLPGRKAYQLEIQLVDAHLDQVLYPPTVSTPTAKQGAIKGRVNGQMTFRRELDNHQQQGLFSVSIDQAVMGSLPLLAQLLHVINLQMPREGAFQNALIQGHTAGNKTNFDHIRLWGSAVSLTGAGFMKGPYFQHSDSKKLEEKEKNEEGIGLAQRPLRLVFMVDAPEYMRHIPLITSFYKAVRPELIQVRVSGTFNNPKVEPTAFPSISDALTGWEQREK